MNRSLIGFHPILDLLLALALAVGGLAVSVQASAAEDMAAGSPSIASADVPQFPGCPVSPNCADLQVFLLIDDSNSMRYSDPTGQRIEGARNVLDILAREYYLPAVEANANDPNVKLPDIKVSLIHFSTNAAPRPAYWNTINPRTLDEWASQLKAFDGDLQRMTPPQTTDFQTAFDNAAELAGKTPTSDRCPRLVMLFTDGVPDLNWHDLRDPDLTQYMTRLQDNLQKTFNREHDLLFVTTFGSGLSSIHRQLWEETTNDSAKLDPRRVQSVPIEALASRMERIVASTFGAQVNALKPTPGKARQYVTEIPTLVESLRLTYYLIQPSASFIVTGPGGKVVQPDGMNVILTDVSPSIHVMEILNPAPGSYHIRTTSSRGLLTELLRFETIAARLSSPTDGLLQLTEGQIGIQLLGADGKPLPTSSLVKLQARVIQANTPEDLDLIPGTDTFTAEWMPLTGDSAAVYACATLNYQADKTAVLYNNLVKDIRVDPVTVKVGLPQNACIPTEGLTSVPLQLINGRSQLPIALDLPVKWSSDSGGTISPLDAKSGQYVLGFEPPKSPGKMQFRVTAAVAVDGQATVFYDTTRNNPISVDIQPPRHLALTLENSETLADRLSTMLYRGFHPACIDEHTEIVLGRHLFGWLGPTPVRINGRLMDITNEVSEPGIERFSVQFRSVNGGASSEMLNSWTTPQTQDDLSTLEFPSPGLGLYSVTVTDQGKNPACAVLDDLRPRNVLLVNDFWEYMPIPILILILALLVLYLFRRYRTRRFSHEIPLLLSSIVLISLNVVLVNLLISRTLKCQLNCSYLVDRTLDTRTLCKEGVQVSIPEEPFVLIRGTHVEVLGFELWVTKPVTIDPLTLRILPRMNAMDPPLEVFRQSIARVIVVLIALASLILTIFVGRLLTSEWRRTFLGYLGLWALIFVIFCGVFFIRVAAK